MIPRLQIQPFLRRLLPIAVFLLVACVVTLHAEDAAPAPAAGATKDKTVIDMYQQGGVVMHFLLLASVLLVSFTVEGFIKLSPKKLAPPALIARLRESIAAGNYQEAWEICQKNRVFLANVLGPALERIGRGRDAIDSAIQEYSVKEATKLKTNITYLSVIGVVTPMIGLTGTVVGMIKAFSTLGSSGIANPSELAAHIGEVLVATASGLVVAIPAFVFFYVLRARHQVAVLTADTEAFRMVEDIPAEQLAGMKIGENFAPASGGVAPTRRGSGSQKVSMSLTTNCPACNFPVAAGTNPCPNCGTVLDWGA
jgi:biopolymer transport protein ExbB